METLNKGFLLKAFKYLIAVDVLENVFVLNAGLNPAKVLT
jgi:hypothetical protein